MNILFWNTDIPKEGDAKAEDIDMCLIRLVIENRVDLLVLAEYGSCIESLARVVSNMSGVQFKPVIGSNGKIKSIINVMYDVQTLPEASRYQIIKVSTARYDLLVAMIHSDSMLYSRKNRQEEVLRWFHHAIVEAEKEHQCNKVIAIGDFNVNPFDEACLNAGIMFAVPFREEVVGKPSRDMDGRSYRKFYNPTWRFYGNRIAPYATYHYHDSSDMANCYWNAIDQVMVRPALMSAFDEDEFRIITNTTLHSLLCNGKPNRKKYSDHLPLLCVLKEELI